MRAMSFTSAADFKIVSDAHPAVNSNHGNRVPLILTLSRGFVPPPLAIKSVERDVRLYSATAHTIDAGCFANSRPFP
jgi:hypothetical protein